VSILSAKNLETSYEKLTVFRDLNVEIQEGKVTTIIGPNGCGKSTLLKTMGRILKQKSGKVYLQGQDLNTIPTKEIAKQLALLPQTPIAPGELKVEELISELSNQYTIAIVTHSMQQAARVSDRTAYFHLGDLIEVNSTEKVFTQPDHQLTEAYITGRFG